MDIFYAYPGPAFIAISDTSVIYSEDTAKTWHIDLGYTHNERLLNIHTFTYNTLNAFFIGAENGALFFHAGHYESIEEQNLIQFYLYPNPATEQTLIKAETVITNVEVLDIFGRNVLSVKPNTKTHNLNLSSLASGNYIIRITTKQGYGVQKLIKN